MSNLITVLARRIVLAGQTFVTTVCYPAITGLSIAFQGHFRCYILGWGEVRRIDPDLFGTVWVPSERLLRSPLANRQPDVTVLASVRRAQSWLGLCTGGSK
jgi:hypothetical protein